MRIVSLELLPFSIPFVEKFPLKSKNGFFLRLTDEKGHHAWGEASPLPELGTHREKLADIEKGLPYLSQRVLNLEVQESSLCLNSLAFGLYPSWSQNESFLMGIPSLLFAFEQALMILLMKREKGPMWPFSKNEGQQVKVCALALPGNWQEDNLSLLAESLLQQNFSTVKLKVGQRPLDEEIRLLEKLSQLTQNKIFFRLDANGRLTVEKFLQLEKFLSNLPIDYIEEPFKNLQDYRDHADCSKSTTDSSSYSFAIDEILRENWRSQKQMLWLKNLHPKIKTLIIKPTTFAGLHQTHQLMTYARNNNYQFVLSSTFDTEFTLQTHAYFSQLLGENTKDQGFGTSRFLQFHTHQANVLTLPEKWWQKEPCI